jgi:peptidoglycan/LPS O-acetylase OafA/YrhL
MTLAAPPVTQNILPPPTRVRGYLPSLDGWRAVAILLVLRSHILDDLFPGRWQSSFALNFLNAGGGGLGVMIFFGISGILITSRLINEQNTRGRISLRGFYIRRFFRILPALFALLAVLSILRLFGVIPLGLLDILRSIFFVRNYGPGGGWYTSHIWSLSIEEHFYALWPAAILMFGLRRAGVGAICAAAAITLWRILTVHFDWLHFIGAQPWRTDLQLDGILIPAALAIALSNASVHEQLTNRLVPSLTFAMMAALCLAEIADAKNKHLESLVRIMRPLIISLVLASTILRPSQLLTRLLEWSPLRWIGRLSYSLYLWQQLFTGGDVAPSAKWLIACRQFPINIVAIFACAAASYYLVERPLIAVGHRVARPVTPGRSDVKV